MEIFLDILELVRAHRYMGSTLPTVMESIYAEYGDDEQFYKIILSGVGKNVEIIYREPEHELVVVASVLLDK